MQENLLSEIISSIKNTYDQLTSPKPPINNQGKERPPARSWIPEPKINLEKKEGKDGQA